MTKSTKIKTYRAFYTNGTLGFCADDMGLAWDHARHCVRAPLAPGQNWGTLNDVKFMGWRDADDTEDLGQFRPFKAVA